MNKEIINNSKHIHFIGIGGSGMYPLAQILHSRGYYLTGSDNNETETLQAVREMGIPVYLGQRAENIEGADLIVHTAAILPDNPELIAAKASGVTVLERSELLGLITEEFGNAICVSGTHGKTTVTSMITQILVENKMDISAVIGGKLPLIHGSGRAGKSEVMVCEACEFQDHFLNLAVDTAVILNVDEDHLDYFKNLDNIIKSFRRFCENTTKTIIVNGDDENSMKAVNGIGGKEIITFGFNKENDYFADNIVLKGLVTEFDAYRHGECLGRVTLNVAGKHNVLNALAAIATAENVEVPFCDIKSALFNFRGAGRRFEKYGEVNGITVVDDYAHHPAEIAVTLNSAMKLGYNKVWAVHQPFTFSRTSLLLDDFAEALAIADKVVLAAIMGGREKNTIGIHTQALAEKIEGSIYFEEEEHDANFELVAQYVAENAEEGDLIVTLGCGDVNKVARRILKILENK
ncbi:MAG: UDP-N-acetylmuramate--L-alanine ligase [Oscillospiraceae bacterium]|nr:UDP-N-acetylmuramate--L-alanine ligase [Oscillospiraceae bacterium]